ncbi:MAG TPA: hypothetical protein VMJ65_20385 [Solirubrobacteraceae bacterium]|nr:hypothetical protein [Solirubrobacteraceae bacterium]
MARVSLSSALPVKPRLEFAAAARSEPGTGLAYISSVDREV